MTMLTALLILTSCELGNAINAVDDACPIVLTEGITLTKAESGDSGKSVKLYISINTTFLEVPYSNDKEGWSEVGSTLVGLLNLNTDCMELLSVARKENKNVNIVISSTYGSTLHTYTIFNSIQPGTLPGVKATP